MATLAPIIGQSVALVRHDDAVPYFLRLLSFRECGSIRSIVADNVRAFDGTTNDSAYAIRLGQRLGRDRLDPRGP